MGIINDELGQGGICHRICNAGEIKNRENGMRIVYIIDVDLFFENKLDERIQKS
jgi:hypothetical protein